MGAGWLAELMTRVPRGSDSGQAAWQFLQALNVPFESVVAKVWNMRMFKHIRAQANR